MAFARSKNRGSACSWLSIYDLDARRTPSVPSRSSGTEHGKLGHQALRLPQRAETASAQRAQ